MKLLRGGLTLVFIAGGCVSTTKSPGPWDTDDTRASLGVEAGDPWCAYLGDLRASLDGNGPAPDEATRDAALAAVRAEAAAEKDGDEYWPFRKALICEYVEGAAEKRALYDWVAAAKFLEDARIAASSPPPGKEGGPLVPVFDHLDGDEPESIAPVDLTNADYCDSVETSELALSQQRGPVIEAVGFPGSMKRAPDWLAEVQVAYQRWGREQQEGDLFRPGPVLNGEIARFCHRFHAAFEGAKEYNIKGNLIFLLPELDDPNKSGRLVVEDAEGNDIVLDQVLAAAQLSAGGVDAETVDFFYEDLAASPRLSAAVARANNLPPPKVFNIRFDYNSRDLPLNDPELKALQEELKARDPAEPIRIAVSGHADCVGPRWYNTMISEDRAKVVFEEGILPVLEASGFDGEVMKDPKRVRLSALGEAKPVKMPEGRCESLDENRRVVVVVQ